MPIFWWGLLLILLFSVQLGWTPVSGRIAVQYYIEPVTGFLLIDSLLSGDKGAFRSALVASRSCRRSCSAPCRSRSSRGMTRSAMLEVLGEDYIRTARAKGLSQLRVDRRCTRLRNALIPVVTVIGLQVGVLFTGAILTETIFSWPGIGKWLIEAISRRDYPVLQGGMLLHRRHGDDRQPARRPHLRPDQPAHPAHAMTADDLDRSSARRRRLPQRHRRRIRLREFWGYFRANRGAVVGLVDHRRRAASRRFADVVAPHSPDLTNNAAFLQAAVLAGGRLADLSARHRRDRPRHPLAPDLRRAAVARSSASPSWRCRSLVGIVLGLVAGFVARRRPRSRSCG